MTSGTKERVGIVGCGRMGFSMLKHLIKKGYSVAVCDLSAEALKRAADAGAKTATSPAELAKQCDFVILGVGYTDEVNAVVYGKDGLLDNLAKGAIIAVSSTTSPFVVQEIAAAAKPKGIGVLDAPICRGRFAADEGTLLALVGGEPEIVERGRAVFGTFCSDYAHLGNVGHGQVGKTMNNLLLWVNAVGLIEAGRLAEIHRHRSREAARRADDELRRFRRAQGMGHDLLHLGAERHAGGGRDDRQGRALAADHRRDQGAGERSPPHQGEQPAELDRQGTDEIQLSDDGHSN